ncbi:hypothetical protein GQ600_24067 [Phytophthora cactorum]|nr:hypothetical protein GQ600_24067 [Phytophthora cactorum]
MRSGDPLRLLLVLFTAVPASTASVHRSFQSVHCNLLGPDSNAIGPGAALIARAGSLIAPAAPSRTVRTRFNMATLPCELRRTHKCDAQSEQPAVRGELRAPFHIPCQLASFPHLQ